MWLRLESKSGDLRQAFVSFLEMFPLKCQAQKWLVNYVIVYSYKGAAL